MIGQFWTYTKQTHEESLRLKKKKEEKKQQQQRTKRHKLNEWNNLIFR